MKRCSECGEEMRLAHGMWSHVRKGSCKIQFLRATDAERATEHAPPPPIRRRTWGADASPPPFRFGYLATRGEPAGPGA